MVVVPLSKPADASGAAPDSCAELNLNWLAISAAATLAASGALLIWGKPKSALVAAATGTALVMIDQQETIGEWWNALPNYLAEVQGLLDRVQTALDEAETQRLRIHQVLAK
jgi:hypothetical protein